MAKYVKKYFFTDFHPYLLYNNNIFHIFKGHALRCTTCGDDGVCKPNSEVKVQECKPGTKNCFISLGSDGNGSFVDVKGCADNTGNEFGLRGCLHISGNVKHEINDEYCFCDTDECNSHRCEMEFCSCAFSDPEMCRNITERNKSSKISFP